MPLLTFVIPIRHPQNARDWGLVKANLADTAASIANQRSSDWQAVVVANDGADLPALPAKFIVERVQFPPNSRHERAAGTKDDFYDAFRIDKGRRVLKGMLRTRDSEYFMIVDDDDFVSAQLSSFVGRHREHNGWVIDRGFVWDSGGRLLFTHDDFNHTCGTSLIVKNALYQLPDTFEQADEEWVKSTLGSHIRLAGALGERGTPLSPLPFRGAVYRVANPGSHSGTPGLFRKYLWNKEVARRPWRLLRNLTRFRLVTRTYQREFFGRGDGH